MGFSIGVELVETWCCLQCQRFWIQCVSSENVGNSNIYSLDPVVTIDLILHYKIFLMPRWLYFIDYLCSNIFYIFRRYFVAQFTQFLVAIGVWKIFFSRMFSMSSMWELLTASFLMFQNALGSKWASLLTYFISVFERLVILLTW